MVKSSTIEVKEGLKGEGSFGAVKKKRREEKKKGRQHRPETLEETKKSRPSPEGLNRLSKC